MDGEIFGYEKEKQDLESRHEFKINNDPEFCLHLYEEYGERFGEKLNINCCIYLSSGQKRFPILEDCFTSGAKYKIPYSLTGIRADAPVFLYNLGRLIKMRGLKKRLRNITRGLICKSIKTGYPDLDEWIREDAKLNKFFKDIILDERT